MSIDTPFIELQITLIERLFNELQWNTTSHCVDINYDSVKKTLKYAPEKEIFNAIDKIHMVGGINKISIFGETSDNPKIDTSSTTIIFDLDEDKLSEYLNLLKFQLKTNSNQVFKFRYKITVDFKEGVIRHGNKSYNLPINKNGIKLLSLLLAYYPNIVNFEQIDNEFNFTFERKNNPRLADKRIYEIRDDLLAYLTKSVNLSEKIAKQFVTNIRGKGYKISLKSDI